jgi:hypothetical protein
MVFLRVSRTGALSRIPSDCFRYASEFQTVRVRGQPRNSYPLISLGKMVGGTGIEPVAPSMSRKCSPAELTAPPAGEGLL